MAENSSLTLISSHTIQSQQPPLGPPGNLSVSNALAKPLSSNDVQWGLRRREFVAYVQPKFDLRTGQVNSGEVLARWHHPMYGVLSPATFISVMAREKWLDKLFFELLEQSLAYQIKLHVQGRLIGMAFNLSLGQLMSDTLVDRLETRLRKHSLPLSSLTFEITEDGPSAACATSVEQLNRLRMLGICLSIDDFGTGYSSLLRLCQVPFSEIKLAAEFTRFIDRPGHYPAVIRNTVALAADLGMQLVVEGIETLSQQDQLYEMGAKIGQGFLCAKPMEINAFEGWSQNPQSCSQPRSASRHARPVTGSSTILGAGKTQMSR
jgi:EAL domain-containing protein (putative c-di-GMP-specific phosphodiesterase class I)